jgi:hypothetical protein
MKNTSLTISTLLDWISERNIKEKKKPNPVVVNTKLLPQYAEVPLG